MPVTAVPELDATVVRVAHLLAGPDADRDRVELARRVAEAQVDLNRVRTARRALLRGPMGDPDYVPAKTTTVRQRIAAMLLRRGWQPDSLGARPWLEDLNSPQRLDEPERVASVFTDLSKQLALLDRYERRALSRRKFAVRALDDLSPPLS